jgi:hypothetical protein
MPSKKSIFTPLSILFRPHQKLVHPDMTSFWWRRRVPPPGPIGLLHRSFIAIAGVSQHDAYRRFTRSRKDLVWQFCEYLTASVFSSSIQAGKEIHIRLQNPVLQGAVGCVLILTNMGCGSRQANIRHGLAAGHIKKRSWTRTLSAMTGQTRSLRNS